MSRFLLARALQLRALPRRAFVPFSPIRMFASIPAARPEIEQKVLNILKNFDRVDKNKVALSAHFTKDLGLDSLDAVELVVNFEDEFGIEIPDDEANQIFSGEAAVKYLESYAQKQQALKA